MASPTAVRVARSILLAALAVLCTPPAPGLTPRREPSRFDARVVRDPRVRPGMTTLPVGALPEDDALRVAWTRFAQAHPGEWQIRLDRRSRVPALVQGSGVPWLSRDGGRFPDGTGVTLDRLADSLREFVAANGPVFRTSAAELVLVPAASGRITPETWQVVFTRAVAGVPFEDARFTFSIGHGNLTAWGASRWGDVPARLAPRVAVHDALAAVRRHMGLSADERAELLDPGTLVVLPAAGGEAAGGDADEAGAGYASLLAWRFALRVPGAPGTWTAQVDALTGRVLAFYDDDRYAQVKGGVFPESDDGLCPSGCEQPGWAMPFADVAVDGSPQSASSAGVFHCSPSGGTATTTLAGPYVRIADNCGVISASATCDGDVDLGAGAGTDCTVPAGSSPGNTHAARTSFFHVNRIAEKARWYLPSNTWATQPLQTNLNIDSTCNAFWDGATINMFKSGGGCNNTGEIPGVVQHEWGHGMDANDGGGYDNPSEAYADITEFFEDHTSCIGRGFFRTGRCSGYGDACLNCTGIRDMDWNLRQSHRPATPATFVQPNCGGGGGPCGREEHCEGYVGGEALWDLAARDLPAAGLDEASAWQLAQTLWYRSRTGSGGDAYNCALPSSDGCSSNSWFHKLRTIDDDDGNLANGTPHGAAIFAAFDRHAIACGAAGDASNRSFSTCPAAGSTTLTGAAGSGAASLSWTPATAAATYEVLRNEIGCSHSFTPIARTSGSSYTDDLLADGSTYSYRVQPVGANSACLAPLSNCVAVTPQPFAGVVSFDHAVYGCGALVTVVVRDANIGAPTTAVEVWSSTEPGPQTVTLTQTTPGGARYEGTIATTNGPAAQDGLLSTAHGDILFARYVDADDGTGGVNLERESTARVDCLPPTISGVGTTDVTSYSATIVWTTDEPADSDVLWGPATPPATPAGSATRVTAHAIPLSGLSPCTVYYYRVESTDGAGNNLVADNGGAYFRFETGGTSTATLACRQGAVFLDRFYYGCDHPVEVTVVDKDLDAAPGLRDVVTVSVASDAEPRGEPAVLTETGPSTGIFVGTVLTGSGAPARDGKVALRDDDRLTATYLDADTGTGTAATAYRDAYGQCGPPQVQPSYTYALPFGRHEIQVGAYPATSVRIDWGPTTALGNVLVDADPTDSWHFTLPGLKLCRTYYYKLSATDENGYTATNDNGGQLFQFQAWDIPGRLLYDTFEGASAWFLEGEWQIAAPQGRGGSGGGFPDPSAAWSGATSLGHDLAGLGAFPGDFEPAQDVKAYSPPLTATALSNVKLSFVRQLNSGAGPGDTARVFVRVAADNAVAWESTPGVSDAAWGLQSIDISALAAGRSFRVVFGQSSDGAGQSSGWNVDDVVVKDGSRPDIGACGGCVSRPTFPGIRRTLDRYLCQDAGVSIEWDSAWSTGSGSAVRYNVYRDGSPGFTPSAANLIASGIESGGYLDASAPNGVTNWYLVRAENDETCANGPHNGGLEDTNGRYVEGRDDVTQPVPPDVGPTLRLDAIGGAHVRLAWQAVPGAYEYHVWAGADPRGLAFLQTVGGASTAWDHVGEAARPGNRFYAVRAVNACFDEGP